MLMLVVSGAMSCFAVPGPLEDAHQPLKPLLRDHLFLDQRYSRGATFEVATVDYPKLARSPEWKEYRKGLTRYSGSKVKSAPPDDRKAFWINTYNALVLDIIQAEYPLSPARGSRHGSVQAVPDFFTRPNPVAGSMVSLEEIEGKLESFGDPRVWFALNRGAASSPGAFREPYTQTELTRQLDAAVRNFLADPNKFRIDRDNKKLHFSALLEERAHQFSSAPVSVPSELVSYPLEQRRVIAFLLPYMSRELREYILKEKPSVVFEPFDWSLNVRQ